MLLVVLPAAFFTGFIKEYLLLNASMLLHELGHIAVAGLYGMDIYRVKILPVGINAVISSKNENERNMICLYMAGAAVNLLLAAGGVILIALFFRDSKSIPFFIYSNLYLAIFNLIPVYPLDGGKIAWEISARRLGFFSSAKWIKKISRVFILIVVAAGIFQLIYSRWNISLILIGVFVFFSCRGMEMEAKLMSVKSIIYRKARLLKKGSYQARHLVAIKTMPMNEIIKSMDFDRFHIIYVLDEELVIKSILTEEQVMDGILRYGTEITFDEFISRRDNEAGNTSK
ncbi:MAG TPA: site-2 protease family protein [Clostridia bacterium]